MKYFLIEMAKYLWHEILEFVRDHRAYLRCNLLHKFVCC